MCFFSLNVKQVDIKAAPSNEANAVTSIVFWDGPSHVVGEYVEPPDEDVVICRCCYADPIDEEVGDTKHFG